METPQLRHGMLRVVCEKCALKSVQYKRKYAVGIAVVRNAVNREYHKDFFLNVQLGFMRKICIFP